MPSLADALRELYARIPLGMRLDLQPMQAGCALHGHPERDFAAVHVAGTNGKGSVCAMVEAMARADGMRTGLYTSPHLCRFAERIRLDGEPLEDEALTEVLLLALGGSPPLSFFEAATMAAFLAFRRARVDVAIVEVGIGGRLDATNVIPPPRAAAITRIALDHVDRLGGTLEAIAREKAGIAKPGMDLVLGAMPPGIRAVIERVAAEAGATTTSIDPASPRRAVALAGDHQQGNARVAVALAERLGISPSAIASGLASVRWPGRLERIGRFLLDAAHNPDGAASLARYVESLGISPDDVSLVFGTLADKDWRPMLDLLAPLARRRIYVAPPASARSMVDPLELCRHRSGEVAEGVGEALDSASGGLVIVAGSIVLVGDARARLLSLPRDPPVAL